MKRVVLVDLAKPHKHINDVVDELGELRSLVKTYGGVDVVHIIQHRTRPDKNTFIGSGKVIELAQIVRDKKIDLVIINDIVRPTQIFHLTKALWPSNHLIEVWDRIDLILNIFNKHAHTAEAKLQIEIAKMNHMGPRMYGLGGNLLSKQGAGIGTRGLGETNVELMKRHWRTLIKNKKEQLAKIEKLRENQILKRRNFGLPSVAIIGYTNAGKTSLFNLLTNKKKLVRDAPFATLDSVSGTVYIRELGKKIFISDTIGFIRDLPPELIETFKSTLLESVHCDLLLHVVDVADPKSEEHIKTVRDIIKSLNIGIKKEIIIFNKIDLHNGISNQPIPYLLRKYRQNVPVPVSVKTESNISAILEKFSGLLY